MTWDVFQYSPGLELLSPAFLLVSIRAEMETAAASLDPHAQTRLLRVCLIPAVKWPRAGDAQTGAPAR